MATLVLTSLGTAIGGPLGGAIGGLLGRSLDQKILGGGSREGPRLKELDVTTSSYGRAIPRIFGRMRVAGTVVWSTELVESSSTSGGKGQPSTTTYSYSTSFAVALSSTPIVRVGRIWADGNLLRGAGEDLKVGGVMRTYCGHGNDPIDPLIEADKGIAAVAFRDCAYVVFEDLQLAEFGNRIPALTFEVFADEVDQVSLRALAPRSQTRSPDETVAHALGYADEGGAIANALATFDAVLPLSCKVDGDGIELSSGIEIPANIPTLPQQLAVSDGGAAEERFRQRGGFPDRVPLALRYYDEGRDYQPGVQRANRTHANGREQMLDLPVTMAADGARQLAVANAQRSQWRAERTIWRINQIERSIGPGSVVRLPDAAGNWLITSWEWFDRGIELGLERLAPQIGATAGGDSGQPNQPIDLLAPPTQLAFMELPQDHTQDTSSRVLVAAATADTDGWKGAALFAKQGTSLIPVGTTGSRRAVMGELTQSLGASAGLFFEPNSALEVLVRAPDLGFTSADLTALVGDANRIAVGGEVIQFGCAEDLGGGHWRLSGLIRGRGGTEDRAAIGHDVGTVITLLDDKITLLDPTQFALGSDASLAAIGQGDDEPAYAELANKGSSRQPPCPVHPQYKWAPDGSLELLWTRRARGQWRWETIFEIPLIESEERYLVGHGDPDAPNRTWSVPIPELTLSAAELSELSSLYGSNPLWVRQVGTFDQSPPLLLTNLS